MREKLRVKTLTQRIENADKVMGICQSGFSFLRRADQSKLIFF